MSDGAGEIHAYRVVFSDQEIANYLQRAHLILTKGALVPGRNNAELEAAFEALTRASHAVAVASGTAALEIAFRCLGLDGKTVLVPANTNYATAEAVLRAGGRVELYDSGLYADIEAIQRSWTSSVAGIVVVHIGGYMSPQLPEIVDWCQQNQIPLIEDASHAHGATWDGRPAGSFGAAAAFSMFATKVITTGEGGMLVTSDDVIASDSRRYRDQGKSDDGVHNVLFGSAWRMSELHAALGLVQLDSLSRVLQRANRVADRYALEIAHPCVEVPRQPDATISGHKLVTVVRDGLRDELRAHLQSCGIQTAKGVYDVPLHQQPVLGLDPPRGGMRLANSFSTDHLCLPMWKGLTDSDQTRVIEAINTWRP